MSTWLVSEEASAGSHTGEKPHIRTYRSRGWCNGKLRTSTSRRLEGETKKPGKTARAALIGSEISVTCETSAHVKRP